MLIGIRKRKTRRRRRTLCQFALTPPKSMPLYCDDPTLSYDSFKSSCHTALTENEIDSLMLNAMILAERVDLVGIMLTKISLRSDIDLTMLTWTDEMGYSPVTRCMQSGNQAIFDMIVNFVREQRSRTNTITTEPCDDELGTIMFFMEFPMNPNFTPLKCFTLLLKPLYFNLFYVIKFMHLLGVSLKQAYH